VIPVSLSMRTTTLLTVLGTTLLLACDSKSDAAAGQSGSGGAPAQQPQAAPPGAGGRAPTPEPGADGPKEREHAATPANALGSRPKGVGLEVGAMLPDVSAHDAQGREVSLRQLAKAEGPLLLVFYRGGWCPYCNFQVRSLTTHAAAFQKRGVLPVLISVDRQSVAARSKQTYDVPFPVLSDSDLSVHEAFHVLNQMHDSTASRMKGRGIDLEEYSGRKHHTVAIPSVFLIEKDGRIAFSHAARDHKTRPTPEQLLGKIDTLGAK